ncbi:MAG: galactokinase [Oscillospiraceae bacterium]|jgi:galactokinase|nr:galactokinase [Oscillospiraceae bacterium]
MAKLLSLADARSRISSGGCDRDIARYYACGPERPEQQAHYRNRFLTAIARFQEIYGGTAAREIAIFSAPGRTEVGGNHTDHQRGRVLAASVNLDVIAVVSPRQDTTIRVQSEGYPEDVLDAADTAPRPEEAGTSLALIRGICARFEQLGYHPGGFDAYTTSDVLSGSGLSSSAAFEVLIGTLINGLFCEGKESPLRIAQIGKYAENVYFDKPSGLMDQTASSVGGLVMIDFADLENPLVRQVDFDFAASGHALCIIDTRGSHADLTPDYAAIPSEMRKIAAHFGKEVLREVDEQDFCAAIPALREEASDRAVLRALHFYGDNQRVLHEAEALEQRDFSRFKELILESGRSSFCYLQNVYAPAHPEMQGVSLTLALCERLLSSCGGAWRVHGGGFAGTVQAFVPNEALEAFSAGIEAVLGEGSCHVLQIRPAGGSRLL